MSSIEKILGIVLLAILFVSLFLIFTGIFIVGLIGILLSILVYIIMKVLGMLGKQISVSFSNDYFSVHAPEELWLPIIKGIAKSTVEFSKGFRIYSEGEKAPYDAKDVRMIKENIEEDINRYIVPKGKSIQDTDFDGFKGGDYKFPIISFGKEQLAEDEEIIAFYNFKLSGDEIKEVLLTVIENEGLKNIRINIVDNS